MSACAQCGIDEDNLTVDDAVTTIRTLPRRYRQALAGLDANALTRPDASGWSLLAHVAAARRALDELASALPGVLTRPGTSVEDIPVEPAGPPSPHDPDRELSAIGEASAALVGRAEAAPSAAWDRPFVFGGHEVPARRIVQRAAHAGAHHLREMERHPSSAGRDSDDD
ncbi:MAG: hypothetical protein E6G60_17465 [Actinobacteria bacterium]|nr:MAG: hypothetical protein E6G60_17465 [Actinomycetota bacterium]